MMLVPCYIIKPFGFSEDGVAIIRAEPGRVMNIPDGLVPGLAQSGYLRAESKDFGASPENKMMAAAPENKAQATDSSPDDAGISRSPPVSDRVDPTLVAEAETLGIKVDGRWREARLRDEIAKMKQGGAG